MQHWRPVLRGPAPRSLRPWRPVRPLNQPEQCVRRFTESRKRHRPKAARVRGALLGGLERSTDPATSEFIQSHMVQREVDRLAAHYGANVAPHYVPNDYMEDPPAAADVSIELLMASQTHLGHSTALWHPANSKYIFGVREGIHIISLDVTAALLRRAATVVAAVAEKGGIILIAGTRKNQDQIVVHAAKMAGACHLFERWVPGSITNGQQILDRCESMVVDEFDREIAGFTQQLVNRPVIKPDLVVCLNTLENYVMLHECALAGIPTIGIVDTDTNPSWVTYPIPANDDSLRSVALIGGVLGRAGKDGQARRRAAALSGVMTFAPPTDLNPLSREEDEDEDKDSAQDPAASDNKKASDGQNDGRPPLRAEEPDPDFEEEDVPEAVMFESPSEAPQEAPLARRNVEKEEEDISRGAPHA